MANETFTFLKKCYRASYFKMATTFNQKWKGNPFSIDIFKLIYLSMWIFLLKQYKNASFGPTFSYYKVPHWVTPRGMVSAHKKVLKSTNGATPPPMEKPVRYVKPPLYWYNFVPQFVHILTCVVQLIEAVIWASDWHTLHQLRFDIIWWQQKNIYVLQ